MNKFDSVTDKTIVATHSDKSSISSLVNMSNPLEVQSLTNSNKNVSTDLPQSNQLIFNNPFSGTCNGDAASILADQNALQSATAATMQNSDGTGFQDFAKNVETLMDSQLKVLDLELKAMENEFAMLFQSLESMGAGGSSTTPGTGGDSGAGNTGSTGTGGDSGAGNTGSVDSGPNALHVADMGGFRGLDTVNAQGQGFSQRYGVFEATMKLPTQGWPGFWMMSVDHQTQGAPASEIDIMEKNSAWSTNQNSYFATLHKNSADQSGGPNSDQQNANNHITTFADGTPLPQDLTTAYHTYGVIWPKDGNTITYTLDGKAVSTIPKYDTTDSSPMQIILSGGADVKSINAYQYQGLNDSSNDPGGTKYGDTALSRDINGQTLVNTFHQDFTAANENVSSIVSSDGAANNTPFTDHMWFESAPANDNGISVISGS